MPSIQRARFSPRSAESPRALLSAGAAGGGARGAADAGAMREGVCEAQQERRGGRGSDLTIAITVTGVIIVGVIGNADPFARGLA